VEDVIPDVLANLSDRAVSGGVVTGLAQAAKFVLNLVAAVVLARLLGPTEFGLVAMVGAITTYLGMLKDAGLSTATIQRELVTQRQVSNLFWVNVALGATMTVTGVLLAPGVAWFYGDPRLAPIMLCLSISFLLTASTVQHHALLARQMRFKVLGIIDVGALLAGVVVGCALAYLGLGYWSLVAMQLSTAGISLALTWWASGWRPSLPSRRSGTRPLLQFGAHLTASQMVSRLAWGSDSLLIGRVHGAEALGLYSRASVLLMRPLEQVMSPIGSVLVPVLSRVRSDPERYKRIFLQVYETVAVFTFPGTALLFALARPLVLLLLGPGWEGAVPLFAGFTLAAIYIPLAFATSWLFTSQGRGQDTLQSSAILSMVTVLAYVAGLPYGALGVVVAFSTSGLCIRLPILYHLAGRSGPVGTGDLWKGFLLNLPSWAVVYAVTMAVRLLLGEVTLWMEALVAGTAGASSAGLLMLGMRRQRSIVFRAGRVLRSSLSGEARA
jgi:PST family polysaccharide transporter